MVVGVYWPPPIARAFELARKGMEMSARPPRASAANVGGPDLCPWPRQPRLRVGDRKIPLEVR
jgi:hypothetical protein